MEYAKELQMDSQEAAVRMEEGRLYLPSDEEIMKNSLTVWKSSMITTRPDPMTKSSGLPC